MPLDEIFLGCLERLEIIRDGHDLVVDIGQAIRVGFLAKPAMEQQLATLLHGPTMFGPPDLPVPCCDPNIEKSLSLIHISEPTRPY